MTRHTARTTLRYTGFGLLLVVGAFGLGRILPAWLEIAVLGLAVLSFTGVFVLHLRSREDISRVPRSTFWTLIGCLFAVALFIGQLTIAFPAGWTEKHPVIFISVINLLMWPVILAGVVVQIRRWHDRNKSGWWILLNLIPYLGQAWAVIELGFVRGTKGPNQFGPDPLSSSPPKDRSDAAQSAAAASQATPKVAQRDDAAVAVARSLDQYDPQREAKPPPPPSPTLPASIPL